ncbi:MULTISPECIES: nucleotide sugar dehydrogenase [Psychrobacter]|uniref:UDP-glucose dehydrogenase n=1 Tax=Psychrobacter alimentarius TaxID=261164 RepID=A0ABM5ZUW3_9GAMM|nr:MULTISPECIES: nucleotide sugar dehydrogenase [Psychrobacter]AMT95779.1 UDP-glucose dehydrogenase [Psychrobacter alimentarius]QCB31795.1 nucleotide sugar dehydrogenase [Psychrobacter sp. PAMC27889]
MNSKKIAIIGLGYVGLPLACAFAKQYDVIGFDINTTRINELSNNIDKTREVTSEYLQNISRLNFISDTSELATANVFIITVPTPIDDNNLPDLSPLVKASQMLSNILKKDDIVIYESTVYPGATEEVCIPELEESGLKLNKDFGVGYSPERINPGDKLRTVENILKVTSGSNAYYTDVVDELYGSVITAGTFKASSIKVAEASKVIENTQRDVNIALINELALIFNEVGIDTHEVIEAAATKWNFIKLMPGLVGGHCIGVDPYYLAHKASSLGLNPNLILTSRAINNSMSKFVAEQTIKKLISYGKNIKDARILLLGVTFKENCPDVRNTKVTDIGSELEKYGVKMTYSDPWVTEEDWNNLNVECVDYKAIEQNSFDAVIVAVNHSEFIDEDKKIDSFCTRPKVVIDVKGTLVNPDWRL